MKKDLVVVRRYVPRSRGPAALGRLTLRTQAEPKLTRHNPSRSSAVPADGPVGLKDLNILGDADGSDDPDEAETDKEDFQGADRGGNHNRVATIDDNSSARALRSEMVNIKSRFRQLREGTSNGVERPVGLRNRPLSLAVDSTQQLDSRPSRYNLRKRVQENYNPSSRGALESPKKVQKR